MENKNNTPSEIWEALKNSKTPLICMDSRLDYDALSSALAFSKIIKNDLNKKAPIIFGGKIGKELSEFLDFSEVIQETDIKDYDLSPYDLLIFLDSGDAHHISFDKNFILPLEKLKLNIDHHDTNDFYGDYNYVVKRGSTCSILYDLFKEWSIVLDKETANNFALSIIDDTHFFQYSVVTSRDFEIISELMSLGVDYHHICWLLSFNETYDGMKLKATIFSNLKVNFEKRYAYSTISAKEWKENNIDRLNTRIYYADLIKTLKGVDFVFVVDEVDSENKIFYLSFRSHDLNFDVSQMAKKFGGGGYKVAGGAQVRGYGSVEEVVKLIQSSFSL